MAAKPQNVRTHTRRTASGKVSQVRQHSRTGRNRKQRKALVSPRHAWMLAKRAHAAARKHKKGVAVALVALAGLEVGAWTALRGVGLMLGAAGALALLVAALAAVASGVDL